MGNFLFQAAAALAYGWDHDMEVTMPAKPYLPKLYPIYLPHLRNKEYDPSLPLWTIKEEGFPHQELPFEESWREGNVMLDGYWQSEKYFLHYRASILEAFGFEWKHLPGWVSIHVRRGDYLRLREKHPPVPAGWIYDQMDKFPGFKFKFFSDDIHWCKETFGRHAHCHFSSNRDEVTDLVEMTWCEHHICSASTFSWWAAWLDQNPNKQIIMPRLWFVPGWGGLDIRDIVPTHWERA